MNSLIEIITLSLVQGLTEFLPISSSAHLILIPLITGWPDQGLSFDVAAHLGTLLSVCLYFRKEIIYLTLGFFRLCQNRPSRFYSPLAWQLIIATLPVCLTGWLLHHIIATQLRSPLIIAFSTLFFGILLLLSDRLSLQKKSLRQLSWKEALYIGLAQIAALIPGTSRSGITLTAALFLGVKRKCAATFSFLLSIPVIFMAGAYEGIHVLSAPSTFSLRPFFTAVFLSFLSAYLCIHLFLGFIQKVGLLPFALYRFLLGALLLFLFW